MIHEAAHALLHTEDTAENMHRGLAECEAESVAYVLAGIAGLDTANYSIGYIAGWTNGDFHLIRTTASRVLRTVHQLAEALEVA